MVGSREGMRKGRMKRGRGWRSEEVGKEWEGWREGRGGREIGKEGGEEEGDREGR